MLALPVWWLAHPCYVAVTIGASMSKVLGQPNSCVSWPFSLTSTTP